MRRLSSLIIGLLLWSVPMWAQSYASPVRFEWDAVPNVTAYRLYVDRTDGTNAALVEFTATQTDTIVLPAGGYVATVTAYSSGGESPRSNAVPFSIIQATDPACTPPLGNRSVSVVVTNLQKTGSGGAGSKARLDFQVASPNSPITHVAVRSMGADMPGGIADGAAPGYVNALAGLWFTVPIIPGTYVLSVRAQNLYGCTTEIVTTKQVIAK